MTARRLEAIVITGATGTGKSGLAVLVAERLAGAVISADSRQVYRRLDIGTAKPGPELRTRVPHRGFDLLDPHETYSAGEFARDAWRWIREARQRDRVPIIVGGSGFFIRALLSPLAPEPDVDPELRAQLRRYLDRVPVTQLKRWLRRLDRRRAEDLEEEGGPQRLSRALEVTLLSGRPHSWWLAQTPETEPLAALTFCLTLERETLYERVDRRFERMMAAGLLDEVRGVIEEFGEEAPALGSVGYAELVAHLKGESTLEEAVAEAKRATRRFARRQLTWFRHQLPRDAVRLDAARPLALLADEIVRAWRDRAPVGLAGDGSHE